MTTTIYLSKLFGLFMILSGIAFILNWKNFKGMVDEIVRNKGSFYLMVMLELIGGLAIVLSHYIWNSLLTVLISGIGLIMIIEAFLYMIIPNRIMTRFINLFNKKFVYMIGGLIYLVLGAFFAYHGFFA